jgi:ABC-type Fe3+ transport system substrate-binding protein
MERRIRSSGIQHRRAYALTAVAASAAIVLAGCGAPTDKPSDSSGAYGEWDTPAMQSLIEAAQKEGELTIVAGPNDSQYATKTWDAFSKQFGIDIQVISGTPDDITTRVLAENEQGIHQVDIGIMGNGSTSRLVEAGMFQKLAPLLMLDDVTDRSSGWYLDYMPWAPADETQSECTVTAVIPLQGVISGYYNTEKVSESDLANLKSWHDLLTPQYKGKIVISNLGADVDSSDRIQSWVILGEDNFSEFVTQDLTIATDDREMSDGLARGEWSIALFPIAVDPFDSAVDQGLPIKAFEPDQFTELAPDLGGRLCAFAQPAHPNATKLFVNWGLSKDGMTAFNEFDGNPEPEQVALRSDVPQGTRSDEAWASVDDPDFTPFDASKHPEAVEESLNWWKDILDELNLTS